jgi:hypothetical protein
MSGRKVSRGVFWAVVLSILLFSADSTAQKAKKARPPHKAAGVEGGGAAKNGKNPAKQMWRREKALASASRVGAIGKAGARRGDVRAAVPIASGALGRSSVALNDGNSLVFTKTFPGTACGAEFQSAPSWTASTAFGTDRIVEPTGTANRAILFQATTGGTTGATQPAWPTTVGATVADGTVVWTAIAFPPIAREHRTSTAYAAGAFVHPNQATGFLYEATTGGTTGGSSPVFPTTVGATVADGTVVWTTRAAVAGTFVGCDPMQLVLRSAAGTETTIATEGQALPAGMQLAGWGEFYDLNNAGVAAFKAAVAGLAMTAETGGADESGTGLFSSPPLTLHARAGDVVSGRTICGFGSIVAINEAGQIGFTGFSPNATNNCSDEDNNGVYRFTPGTGVEFLIGVGTDVGGGVTVTGVGKFGGMNELGHTVANVDLSDGDEAVYLLTGPGAFTEVARSGNPGPGANYDQVAHAEVNDTDQVVFKASLGGDGSAGTEDDGTDSLLLFTPGSGTQIIAQRDTAAPGGGTYQGFTAFMDINNLGDVAFMAGLNGTQVGVDDGEPAGIFFWDRTNNTICEVQRLATGFFGFFAEVITVNNAKSVLFGTKAAGSPPGINDTDIQEEGLYLWTAGIVTPVIRIGDVLDGAPVTAVFAQHQSFEYQLNEVCGVASAAFVNNDEPDDVQENAINGKLFVSFPAGCPAGACGGVGPTPTFTPTGPVPPSVTPTTTPIVGQVPVVPTLSLPMMILLGLALAGVAFLVLRKV